MTNDAQDKAAPTPTDATEPDTSDWAGRIVQSIKDIDASIWDLCNREDHPFTSYAFFSSLEDGETLGPATGWGIRYLLLERQSDKFVGGILPMFAKGHSYGEYVFDHAWAQAFEAAGGSYYPKLLGAVPFTPATGPRFLVHPALEYAHGRRMLALLAAALCGQQGLSSLHLNFIREDDAKALEADGYLIRNDQQFHWFNDGFETFDDFLATLASRKRKAIRKERRGALAGGHTIHQLTGDAITSEHWDAFFRFYLDTGARKWGRPYLTRAFFEHLGERMADKLLLVMVKAPEGDSAREEEGEDESGEESGDDEDILGDTPSWRQPASGGWVAGALNIIDKDCLYGRYWGCLYDIPYMHFEVCYYQAIDYAIQHRLGRVEAGAQGQHKLARGYRPTRTYSAHHLVDKGFREAVDHYLARERTAVSEEMAYLEEFAPFKKG